MCTCCVRPIPRGEGVGVGVTYDTAEVVQPGGTPRILLGMTDADRDEAELWAKARDGYAEAFASVFDVHRDRLFGHALRLVGSWPDAEYVAASAFLELPRRRRDVRLVNWFALPWLLVTRVETLRGRGGGTATSGPGGRTRASRPRLPQTLPPNSTRSSSRLCAPSRSRSSHAGILLGQPSLARQLRLGVFAALDQRIAVRYHIGPMDLGDSTACLRHHFALAGRSDQLFADDAIVRLHRQSNGIPRALNNAAVAALIAAAADGKEIVDDACAKKAVAEFTRDQ